MSVLADILVREMAIVVPKPTVVEESAVTVGSSRRESAVEDHHTFVERGAVAVLPLGVRLVQWSGMES